MPLSSLPARLGSRIHAVNQTLDSSEANTSARATLSVLSGLAVLCILAALLFGSTFIAAGEGGQTSRLNNTPPPAFQRDPAPVPSLTFYLFDSEAQVEEKRKLLELAADQVAHTPLLHYPHVVTLVASTAEEESLAYAKIVKQVRFREGEPLSIEFVDLRTQEPK
jgi:hypothetical protein